METSIPEPLPLERRRSAIGLARPIWLGLLTVVLVVMGALIYAFAQFDGQIRAIAAIEHQGGVVGTLRRRPGWQREILGSPGYKAFEVVEFVNLEGTPISDTDLDLLLALPSIQRLNLRRTRVTDAGVSRLKELPNLKLVLLEGTAVSDVGIDDLHRALPELKIEQ
jgi:hypothetical protein